MNEDVTVKKKKRFYKKWWFWVIVVIVLIASAQPKTDNQSTTQTAQQNEPQATVVASAPTEIAKEVKVQQTPQSTPAPATPKPTTHPLPKISFTGSAEPSIVRVGEKVVLKFEVENQDSTQSIDGMRILFANSDFVNKAITVVNVMNGGEQDGKAFDWPPESSMLMKIAPKEKRTFTIVASAKERGSYESVITFKASRVQGINETFDTQDRELTAKLIVL